MSTAGSTIIIPSLAPDKKLIDYIKSLIDLGFRHIIVVDDGSAAEYSSIFREIENIPECAVLRHHRNRGKGCALKTAMEYYIANIHDSTGIITVDADGQHAAKDIRRISELMDTALQEKIILGARNFAGRNIPLRSRFGNIVTSRIIQILHGQYFSDTQTGLRAFPDSLVKKLCRDVAGEKYEYEMNVVLYAVHHGITIQEVEIETIYNTQENGRSHFRPVIDSVRIYTVILKSFLFYSLSGILSAVVDLAIFTLIVKLILHKSDAAGIFTATAVARVCSSFFNYSVNRSLVFLSTTRISTSMIKYYCLCIVQMSLSAGLVYSFHHLLRIDEVLVKAAVDGLLFFASYQVQKRWVFRPSRPKIDDEI